MPKTLLILGIVIITSWYYPTNKMSRALLATGFCLVMLLESITLMSFTQTLAVLTILQENEFSLGMLVLEYNYTKNIGRLQS